MLVLSMFLISCTMCTMSKESPLLPVVAIVGRPNVGKSTLFNRLTKSRDAIVANRPGLTRDRQYGYCRLEEGHFIVVDTGGIGEAEDNIDQLMEGQSYQAIKEASILLFMVDARDGLTAADQMVIEKLRRFSKPIMLVVNKIDGLAVEDVAADFYQLGIKEISFVSASNNRGIQKLTREIILLLPESNVDYEEKIQGIKLAIVGKPNAGKSTLVNRMLGEDRVIVSDQPGTTRDSIFIPLERRGKQYTLIDTAGVRKRSKVFDLVEKFSIIKTLQAIEESNVVLVVLDAREGIAEQDLRILGYVLDAGKSLIIAVNKWDGLSDDDKKTVKTELDRRCDFVSFAKIHFISALHGTGVGDLYRFVDNAYRSSMKKIATPEATKILESAVFKHQPPMVSGRRIKLRYAHVGGHNPPIIVIHGNQAKLLPLSYVRYLENFYRQALKLVGTPIRIQLKTTENPYKDRKMSKQNNIRNQVSKRK